ncbi:MAG: HEAT repeat domain-containing protein [Planctomycetes bacterium]|nr:HEAT repeat domain-containing protein [Planctomycetota bacterium]
MRKVRPNCVAILLFAVVGVAASEESTDVFSQELARFRALLSSPLPERRIEAIQGLAYLKVPSCEGVLLRLLKDPSVRRETAIALGRCGTAKSIPALIALLSDPAWEVRVQARDALCRMTAQTLEMDDKAAWENWWGAGDPAAREKVLIDGLASKDADVRLRSLRALRFLGSKGAEDALLTFVKAKRSSTNTDSRSWPWRESARKKQSRILPDSGGGPRRRGRWGALAAPMRKPRCSRS